MLKCNYLWSIKSFICPHLNSSQLHKLCSHHDYVVLLVQKAQTCLEGQKFIPLLDDSTNTRQVAEKFFVIGSKPTCYHFANVLILRLNIEELC